MGFGDFELIHWMLFLWPVPVLALVVALYLVKRKTGQQGWRRPVLKVLGSGHHAISWAMRGLSIGIGFVWKKHLSRLPWKPILIWGPWVVVVLLVGFYTIENWRGTRAWERERAAWRARGETLRVQDFMPAPIPEAENFARHPAVLGLRSAHPPVGGPVQGKLKGFTSNTVEVWNGNPQLGKPVDVRLWLPVSTRPPNEETSARQCLTLMDSIETPMAGIAEAVRRPGCNFGLVAGRSAIGNGWENPIGRNFIDLADAFRSRAVLHLRAGENGQALRDLESCVLLAAHLEADPKLIARLIEVAVLRGVEYPLWEGLRGEVWTDAQLRDLEDLLRRIDLPKRGLRVVRTHSAMLAAYYDDLKEDRTFVHYWGDPLAWLRGSWTPDLWDDLVDELEGPASFAMPRGWFDGWLADSLQRIDRSVLRPDGVPAERLAVSMIGPVKREMDELTLAYMGSTRFILIGQMDSYIGRIIAVQGKVDLMRVAIALERFRMRTGAYPMDLGELVPTELPELPLDLVTGEALFYRIKPDGTPLVYAVGFNGIDDGGVPARDAEHLDWVWQYSGTPGQTKYDWFYGKPPMAP